MDINAAWPDIYGKGYIHQFQMFKKFSKDKSKGSLSFQVQKEVSPSHKLPPYKHTMCIPRWNNVETSL